LTSQPFPTLTDLRVVAPASQRATLCALRALEIPSAARPWDAACRNFSGAARPAGASGRRPVAAAPVPRNNTAGFAAGRSVAAAAYLTDGRTADRRGNR